MINKTVLVTNLVGKVTLAKILSRSLKVPFKPIYYTKEKPYEETLYNKEIETVNQFLYKHPYVKQYVKCVHPDNE